MTAHRTRVLRVGRLIDGVADDSQLDAVVCIAEGKIATVGRWRDFSADGSVGETIDLSGFTLLPGLIDAHAHMTLFADGRTYEEMAAESDEAMLAAAQQNSRRHLEGGVTTVRDNGSRNHVGYLLKEAIARGHTPGPRLLVSGPPVTATGGHFSWCNGEADGEDGIGRAIAALVEAGADHIKLMASGGGTAGTDPRRASYSLSELRAAVTVAHSLDRATAAHCRAVESMNRAIDAGVDCIEHADFLRPDGRMVFEAATADRLASAGTYVSPTLPSYGWDTILRLGRASGDRRLAAHEQTALASAEDAMSSQLLNFRRMLEAGLAEQIVGGTDAGCSDFSFGHMDYCLQLMVQGGMSPMAAIKACTSVAARAVGLGGVVGSVTVGSAADLLVVGGDPLSEIAAVSDVRAVIQGGRCVVSRLRELPTDV